MVKKISEMSAQEIQAMKRLIGVPGLPYPMTMYETSKAKEGTVKREVDDVDEEGTVIQKEVPFSVLNAESEMGVIDSLEEAMALYTDTPMEEVQGRLFREMPIPSMLPVLRDLLAKVTPASKNRLMTVFGDPAFGKSYLFKMVASLIHPQGAIQVDCGGMNMREIFFRTVIDYGTGTQDVLNQRLAQGRLSANTINYMNSEFPGCIVTAGDKRVIDWDKIGAPLKNAEDPSQNEDRGASMARGVLMLQNVYAMENITQQNNSFGIKTVPGEFFESLWSGRPLFLDEFNKSKGGTLDTWQTVLQFLNGEEDSVTIYNTMSQSDGDSRVKSITITRDDIKMGWHVSVAGNELKDGSTTQEISESMLTRLHPLYLGNPTQEDWKHRISQTWTGLPLTTLYTMFKQFATLNPDEFGEFLIDLRTLGLSQQKISAIPERELYFLKNWQETLEAVQKVSDLMIFRADIANTNSQRYDKDDSLMMLADEIDNDAKKKQINVSFRNIIEDHNTAITGLPHPHKTEGSVPNLTQALDRAYLAAAPEKQPAWYNYGANMAQAIFESIMNVTKDMPGIRSRILTECKILGIIDDPLKEAAYNKKFKLLPDLMKYDEMKGLGGTMELKAVRTVAMMALRAIDPELKASDEVIMPLENLGHVVTAMKAALESGAGERPIVVPNTNHDEVNTQPVMVVKAVNDLDKDTDAEETLDFRAVLSAIAMPDFAESNMASLWITGLEQEETADENIQRAYDVLMGKSEYEFHLGIIKAKDSADEPVYLYVLEDGYAKKTIVLGPEEIPVQLETELQRNNITYVVKQESKAKESAQVISDFMTVGLRQRVQDGKIILPDAPPGEKIDKEKETIMDEISKHVMNAFLMVGGEPAASQREEVNGQMSLKTQVDLGQLLVYADKVPIAMTQFAKVAQPVSKPAKAAKQARATAPASARL